jgi:hypothetical protein
MKRLIKLAIIVVVIVVGVKLIDQYRGNSAVMLGIAACGLLLISWFARSNSKKKGKSSGGGSRASNASGGGSQGITRDEWYKLYDLTKIYSGYQSLRDYAKVDFSVTLDDYGNFTIDGYLDLSDCEPDVNANDIRASLRYAAQQLQKNILSDARSITNGRVTVSIGRIE